MDVLFLKLQDFACHATEVLSSRATKISAHNPKDRRCRDIGRFGTDLFMIQKCLTTAPEYTTQGLARLLETLDLACQASGDMYS